MTPRDEIAQQAMSLPPEDRQFLADLLERSLPVEQSWSEEIAAVWLREIDRRIDAYDHGETKAVEFDVALDKMRQALEEHRASKSDR